MFILPYCAADSTEWDCIRGCVLGLVNLATFLAVAHALSYVVVVYQRTRRHGLNVLMLVLAALQCLFAFTKYAIKRWSKLTFLTSVARGLQSLVTCSLYSKMACDSIGRPDIFQYRIIPFLGFLVVFLTVLLVEVAFEDDLPCHHPNWLLLSVSSISVNGIFAVSGGAVMKEWWNGRMPSSASLSTHSNGEAVPLSQQRHLLWVLLIVNTVSGLVQLGLDSWLQNLHLHGESCAQLDSGGLEFVRLVLKMLSYDLPVAATYYVFYWFRRREFWSVVGYRFAGTSGRGQNSWEGSRQHLQHSLLDPENDEGVSSGVEAGMHQGRELNEGEGFGLGGVLDEYEREDVASLCVGGGRGGGGRAGAMRRLVRGVGGTVPWSPARAARVRAFEGGSYDPLSTTEEVDISDGEEEAPQRLVVMGAGERVVREQELVEPRVQSPFEVESQMPVDERELSESGEEEKRNEHDSLI